MKITFSRITPKPRDFLNKSNYKKTYSGFFTSIKKKISNWTKSEFFMIFLKFGLFATKITFSQKTPKPRNFLNRSNNKKLNQVILHRLKKN